MKKRISILLLILPISLFSQVTIPNSFSSGETISASEMNANFQTLIDAINQLQSELENKADDFPIGSIIATYVAPDANLHYMTGSDSWAFADGSLPSDATSYTGQFPDMRGQFVRGVNAGRDDGNEDPDVSARTGGDLNDAGSFQDDAFQGHRHSYKSEAKTAQDGGTITVEWYPSYAGTTTYDHKVTDPIADETNGDPRTTSETRPSNIAVYWYIKVK